MHLKATDLVGLSPLQQDSIHKVMDYLDAKIDAGITEFPYIPDTMFCDFDYLQTKSIIDSLRWSWYSSTLTTAPMEKLHYSFNPEAVESISTLTSRIGERRPGFSPMSLYSSGQDGGVFEWGDISTIYQDSVGTTAGVVGQVDGLTLDKRKGLVRGAEIFSDTSVSFGPGASRLSPNVYRVFSATGTDTADILLVGTSLQSAGPWHEITITIDSITALGGGLRIGAAGATGAVITTAGTKTVRVQSDGTGVVAKRVSGVTDMQVSNISVRELPGNHASQSATANKPILQAGHGAFDRFDDYMTAAAGGGGTTGILLCAGIRAGGAGSARTIWSDRGTNTGYRLSINASNQLVLSAGNGTTHTEVLGPTVTAGTDYVVMGWHDGTNLSVRLNLDAATPAPFATATAGTAGFTIGADNGAASGYYGDRIYCLAYRKNDASTPTERDNLTRWAAGKSNVTL